ncbi:MAG: cell division protein CrgA [Acidimicrobiales bacterium]
MTRKTKDTPGPMISKGRTAKRRSPGSHDPAAKSATGRYTAPVAPELRSSPRWLPFVMITLLVVGVVITMTSYLGLPASGARTLYLLLGGALVAAGFFAATRYR